MTATVAEAAQQSAQPSAAAPADRYVHVLRGVDAVSTTDAWAVGDQYVDVNFTATLVRHWDGQSWADVASPSPGDTDTTLTDVAARTRRDVWAVGSRDQQTSTVVEHWDGDVWSVIPSPSPGQESELQAVTTVAADDIWAVGHVYPARDGSIGTLVEHWDGSRWRMVRSPSLGERSRLYGVSASGPDDVWAVGSTEATIGASPGILVEHWDGSSWQIVDAPQFIGSELQDVTALSASDAWAVGWRFGPEYQSRGLIEHWDGTRWRVKHAPNNPHYTAFTSVSGSGPDDIWTVGKPHFEHWDGSQWSLVSGPPEGGGYVLQDVSTLSTKAAWAVGSYRVGHDYYPLEQFWDGNAWNTQEP